MLVGIDIFSYGQSMLALLLFFGDLKTARVGFGKTLDAHERMLARVRTGSAAIDGCVMCPYLFPPAPPPAQCVAQ